MLLRVGYQITVARELVRLTRSALARRAGINGITLRRMEGTKDNPIVARRYSIAVVQRALTDSGVRFLDNGQVILRRSGLH